MTFRTNLTILSAVIMMGLLGTTYALSGILDQSFTGPFNNKANLQFGGYQSFTPAGVDVVGVDAYLSDVNGDPIPSGTYRVLIHNDNAGVPGSIISETYYTISPKSTLIHFDIPPSVNPKEPTYPSLTPGQKYWLQIRLFDVVGAHWMYSSTDGYSGGSGRTGSGPITGDFGFATYSSKIVAPEQQTQAIIDVINDLVNSGDLNKGNGASLTNKLDSAIQKMANNDDATAINLLKAFINQVNAFVNSRTLTPQDGQQLIDAANSVIQGLQ